MSERDNFNLAKFVRNNPLLNESFEGFGGYRDLKPVKEDVSQENEGSYYAEAKGENLFYVDLDSANFDDELFQADLKRNGIKAKIIDPDGPAGGWPVVRYIANSRQTLSDMIARHWANDPDTVADYWDEIQPMNEEEDLGGWDGDGKHNQYDGEYDGETGPAITNEVVDKNQLQKDIRSMIAHIKDGEGYIGGDYIEQTWENLSDIPFSEVQKEVIGALSDADLLNINEADGEYGSYGPWGKPDESEENPWMMDVDGTGEYEVGQFKCYYDYPGYLVWSYSDVPFSKFAVYATPMFDGQDGTPVQVDVNDKTVANLDIPKGIFKSFQDYAKIMVPVLTRLVEKYSDQFEGELDELEKPEKIYADDKEEYGNQDRMFDLGGQQIEQGIIDLLDDGFEPEEVLEMCKMFIDAHTEAAAKGKMYESEYDYQIINGNCYRVDDEGNKTEASMSKCR